MRRRFLINSTSGFIQVLISTLLTVISIPLFLSLLGKEMYGVYSLVTTVSMVGFLINFGFTTLLIKFIGEQGRSVESDRDIVTSFTLSTLLISIVVLIGLTLEGPILKNILQLPPNYLDSSTHILFRCILISNIFLFLGEIPMAVLDSIHKIFVSNSLQFFNTFLNKTGIIIVLLSGGRIAAVGYVFLLTSFIWFMVLLFFFFRNWTFQSSHGLFYGFTATAQKQLRYGSRVYLTGISIFFYEPFTKILISHYIGLVEVGIFDIAFRLKNIVWNLISKILYPLTPLIASQPSHERVRIVIDRISKKILLVVAPLIVMVLFVTRPFVWSWIGKDSESLIFSISTILSGYLLLLPSIPIYQYLMIKNHAEKTFYIQLLNALLSFVLFITTVPIWGYPAAIYSFVGSVLCTNILSIYYQKKYLHSNYFLPIANLVNSCLIAGVLVLFFAVVHTVINNDLVEIIMDVMSALVIVPILFVKLKLFTKDDALFFFGESKLTQSLVSFIH